jgi:carboxyl-terminal processing protease
MDRSKGLRIAGTAAAALVAAGGLFALGYGAGQRGPGAVHGARSDGLGVVRDAYEQIRSGSVDPPPPDALAQGAVRGMIKVLQKSHDNYAAFYSPKDYRSFQEITGGRFSGIGVWLKNRGRDLEVNSVLPSTPAHIAGLKTGDVIKTIGNKPVASMTPNEAIARIKGPPGTRVLLGVKRGDLRLRFHITRASIELPNAVARMTAHRLGYIHLFGFARGAGAQVRNDVHHLVARGARGILLDVRNNGGGLFSEGVRVASVFIQRGPIVRYKERSQPQVVYRAQGDAVSNLPIVVLVNGGTASAAEIVAGALQDRNRAIVVGTRTYGKGSIQEVLPLPDTSAMKLTTAAYFTPSGRSINGTGIRPDVKVGTSPGRQRARATQILRGLVLSSSGAQG